MHRSQLNLLTVTVALALVLLPLRVATADDCTGEAVVLLVDGAQIEDLNAEYGTTVIGRIDPARLYLLQLPEDWTEEDLERFEDDPLVEELDCDYEGGAAEGQTESFYLLVDPLAFDDQYARNDESGKATTTYMNCLRVIFHHGVR